MHSHGTHVHVVMSSQGELVCCHEVVTKHSACIIKIITYVVGIFYMTCQFIIVFFIKTVTLITKFNTNVFITCIYIPYFLNSYS